MTVDRYWRYYPFSVHGHAGGTRLVGAADLDRGAVGADLLADASRRFAVDPHGEDGVCPLGRAHLDQPVLGFGPAGRQQLSHAAQLSADQRLEAGTDLRPDVPGPDGDAEHL